MLRPRATRRTGRIWARARGSINTAVQSLRRVWTVFWPLTSSSCARPATVSSRNNIAETRSVTRSFANLLFAPSVAPCILWSLATFGPVPTRMHPRSRCTVHLCLWSLYVCDVCHGPTTSGLKDVSSNERVVLSTCSPSHRVASAPKIQHRSAQKHPWRSTLSPPRNPTFRFLAAVQSISGGCRDLFRSRSSLRGGLCCKWLGGTSGQLPLPPWHFSLWVVRLLSSLQ